MRKLRQGAVLGSLIVIALLLFTTLPVAGNSGHNFAEILKFFRTLGHALADACDQVADEGACRVVLRAMALTILDVDDRLVDKAMTKEIGKALRLPRRATCDQCLNETKAFLDDLAENVTIQEIESTLHDVCAAAFHNATRVQQCEAFVDQAVPQAIQTLEQLTPLQVCEDLKYCKVK